MAKTNAPTKPAKSATKDLSLTSLKKKDAATYKQTKRVEFPEGKVDVELTFRPTKKAILIAELIDVMKQSIIDLKEVNAQNGLAISMALIVKHFTSLNVEGNTNDFDSLLTLFSLLSDNKYLQPIMSAFDPVELETLYSEINLTISKVIDEVEKVKSDMGIGNGAEIEDENEQEVVDIDA